MLNSKTPAPALAVEPETPLFDMERLWPALMETPFVAVIESLKDAETPGLRVKRVVPLRFRRNTPEPALETVKSPLVPEAR